MHFEKRHDCVLKRRYACVTKRETSAYLTGDTRARERVQEVLETMPVKITNVLFH